MTVIDKCGCGHMLRFLRRGYATTKLLRVLQLRAAQREKVNAQEWLTNKVYSDTWDQYTKYQKVGLLPHRVYTTERP